MTYDLGEAIYRALCSRKGPQSPNTEPRSFSDAVRWFVKNAGGSISAAARLAGVPRRTFRDWVSGSAPRDPGRAAGIVRAALAGERRRRMPPGREQRLRQLDVGNVQVKGAYNYDSGEYKDKARVVDIGQYMADDAIGQCVDAFLSGAGIDELREVFADSIVDDPIGFYPDTMRLPMEDDHGWSVESVWWEGDPGR